MLGGIFMPTDLGALEEKAGAALDKTEEALEKVSELTGVSPWVCGIAIVVLVLLAVYLFTKPIRFVLKLAINTVVGYVVLLLVNRLGADFGINLALTWQNAVVTGIFGIPGVAVLLALRWGGIL